jgi:LacI family transcriptional regulator
VAERANVSTKTVSKVVNNRPDVSKATRERVLAAIDELSYRPNQLARGLATQRSFKLALWCDAPAAGSQYIARIQMAILARCQKAGFYLNVECIHASNKNIAQQAKTLVAQSSIEGVVLAPPLSDLTDLVETLKAAGTPIVRFSPSTPDSQTIDVDIDNVQAAYDVTKYLLSLGHTRIGFVRGPQEHADANRRFEGYRKALAEADIPYEAELCPLGNYAYNTGVQCGVELLGLKQPPTAVFASNDDMAAGVMAASMRFNLHIPGDLSVAGFDDAIISHGVLPRLTTCRQPVDEMADKAIAALLEYGGPKRGAILLPHKLIVRGSTGRPRSV